LSGLITIMAVNESTDNLQNNNDLRHLRDLGRRYLHSDRIDQALQTYVALLNKYPDDVATLVIIGDSYLMAGDSPAAKLIYQDAIRFEPDRKDIQQRIDLADKTTSPKISIAGGFPPLHLQAINRLIERLTGKSSSIDEDQIHRASELLEQTIHSDSPASSVSEHLDEIDALLPAILELNIRQARSQGRVDLAVELVNLQNSILASKTIDQDVDFTSDLQKMVVEPEKKVIRAIVIGESSPISPFRQSVMKMALQQAGISVVDKWEEVAIPRESFDLVIAHNPHINPMFMKALAAWAGSGNPVLVDLDTDFRMIPANYPESKMFMQGNQMDVRSFTASIQLADILTFPSTQAALRFSDDGYVALTVPDGWSKKNTLWTKKGPQSAKFNIGIFTEPGRLESIATIRRVIIRILREFPQTRLVVSGDPEVYPLFDSIPDTRRIYLPPTEPDDYPYLLAQADIQLFPYSEIEYSQLESDRRLMEAGVRKTPWIASPIPAVEEWNTGGFIARSIDDWYTHMKALIQDTELRNQLAQDGFEKAGDREAINLAPIWGSVVRKTLQITRPKPFLRNE
ncbi:MAG TPA: hypothetical protein VF338_03590, partial [Leptolinea sp.]